MTNKIEISRELADRLTRAYPAEITDQETMQAIRIEALSALDELRALLAAPAVERQEPEVHKCQKCYGHGVVPTRHAGEGETEYRDRCKLYTYPPAPVAVVLPERMTFNGDEPEPISISYDVAAGWNACLDKVKEMNP